MHDKKKLRTIIIRRLLSSEDGLTLHTLHPLKLVIGTYISGDVNLLEEISSYKLLVEMTSYHSGNGMLLVEIPSYFGGDVKIPYIP